MYNGNTLAHLCAEVYNEGRQTGRVDGVGFLTASVDNRFVVAIEGTDSLGDWGINLNAFWPKTTGTIRAHRGFISVAQKIFNEVVEDCECAVIDGMGVTFCGHSLGGAIAQLCSEWFYGLTPDRDIRAVTFGSPPVFVRWYRPKSDLRNLQIDDDPVPRVMSLTPFFRHYFRLIYEHKGTVIRRETPGGLSISDHDMNHYMEVFADDLGRPRGE